MTQPRWNRLRLDRRLAGLTVALLITLGVAAWLIAKRDLRLWSEQSETTARIAAGFYASLAALDVEENELAVRRLRGLVQEEPREPALWANLAIGHLRLRDMEAARNALQQAIDRGGNVEPLMVLQAELLVHSGDIERAIVLLRTVAQNNPLRLHSVYQLTELLGQLRSQAAEMERLDWLARIAERAPSNLRVRCDQLRVAAHLEQEAALAEALSELRTRAERWPENAQQQFALAEEAVANRDWRRVAQEFTFVENLLKPLPAYQQSLLQLGVSGASAVGAPVRDFLVLRLPAQQREPAYTDLEFQVHDVATARSGLAARPVFAWSIPQVEKQRSTHLLLLSDRTILAGESAALPFPGSLQEATLASVCAADLNSDRRLDLVLVGGEGVHICWADSDAVFSPPQRIGDQSSTGCHSAWAVDLDADGDLDVFVGRLGEPPMWLRNNGDQSFSNVDSPVTIHDVRQLVAFDADLDGDTDLVTLDSSGQVDLWRNDRSGQYDRVVMTWKAPCVAVGLGDVDQNGVCELLVRSLEGDVFQAAYQSGDNWMMARLVNCGPTPNLTLSDTGKVLLCAEDFDNNGAVDLITSLRHQTTVWLADQGGEWRMLSDIPLYVSSILDIDGDGLLDLVGVTEGNAAEARNRCGAGHGWLNVEPRANTDAGDRRINSFGLGGRVELRAGGQLQTATIISTNVHFGLGRQSRAEVARIVWPNGTVQAEFDLESRTSIVANQRLKGSCPWVFAHDGQSFRFVKDFLWRSPLGLRINGQATAGVTQTEDWIRIPGDQLSPVNGRYLLRITAELWETHFFDHLRLLSVDYPANLVAIVDERFVPTQNVVGNVILVTRPQSLPYAVDHGGRDQQRALRSIDGEYVDQFALGPYQGVAEDHWIEFELPQALDLERPLLLVGHGWVYPTDSSINVAISQHLDVHPQDLVLEQKQPDGSWHPLLTHLGFPAGKNKDVVIRLPRQALHESRRLRLRTNLEVYWDALGWSYQQTDLQPRLSDLQTIRAELGYRGFSKVEAMDRRRPEIPRYHVQKVMQQWLDLEGYYTRFGDVSDLLERVDDRYVIMNAGDEFVLEYREGIPVPAGMRRDFILVGDGWVKDGDLNTSFSRWVRPLPRHDDSQYGGPLTDLTDDPAYQRWSHDWRRYHTRYVTPESFQQRLVPSNRSMPAAEVRMP